jgi:PAS domain S-box-containing protein
MDGKAGDQIHSFAQRIEQLHQRSACVTGPADEVVKEVLQELKVGLHELHVSQKQLRDQKTALAEQRRRYQELFDFAPDAYVVTDPHGVIREANRAAVGLFRTTHERLADQPMIRYFAPEHHQTLRAHIYTLQRGAAEIAEPCKEWQAVIQPREGGVVVSVAISCSPVHDPQRNVTAIRWLIRDITERKQAEEELANSRLQLRLLSAHLQAAREDERAEIAREIHDEFGQALTALKLQLTWLDRHLLMDDSAILQRKVRSMVEQVDKTIDLIRHLSTALRPPGLDDLGLQATVEWYAEQFQTRTGIQCHLDLHHLPPALSREGMTAIFRIYQEALTNVSRHAQASQVYIHLREDDELVILEVIDNGKGISKRQLTSSGALGIIGMRERSIQLGGVIEILRLQKGTKVMARIPLHRIMKTADPDNTDPDNN